MKFLFSLSSVPRTLKIAFQQIKFQFCYWPSAHGQRCQWIQCRHTTFVNNETGYEAFLTMTRNSLPCPETYDQAGHINNALSQSVSRPAFLTSRSAEPFYQNDCCCNNSIQWRGKCLQRLSKFRIRNYFNLKCYRQQCLRVRGTREDIEHRSIRYTARGLTIMTVAVGTWVLSHRKSAFAGFSYSSTWFISSEGVEAPTFSFCRPHLWQYCSTYDEAVFKHYRLYFENCLRILANKTACPTSLLC